MKGGLTLQIITEAASPVEDLSPRENLLIEHPSIFVKVPPSKKEKVKDLDTDKKAVASHQQQHKKYDLNFLYNGSTLKF